MVDLTDHQLERYARHIILREVGGQGQQKLLAARVLIVGAGGLGHPCLQYLAAAGVGTIGIIDDDVVERSNLQRQILFREADIGMPKVAVLADRVAALNPDVRLETHKERLTAATAAQFVARYDIIADGCDNFATRFVINNACVRFGKPLVSAAVGPFEGQLGVFCGHQPDQPCYQCFVPQAPIADDGTCAAEGVLGALTGAIGALQALEVMRLITGFGAGLAGRLLIMDGLGARLRTVTLRKDPACLICQS